MTTIFLFWCQVRYRRLRTKRYTIPHLLNFERFVMSVVGVFKYHTSQFAFRMYKSYLVDQHRKLQIVTKCKQFIFSYQLSNKSSHYNHRRYITQINIPFSLVKIANESACNDLQAVSEVATTLPRFANP